MKKRLSDEQIISVLHEDETGVSAHELCHKHAISDTTFYTRRQNLLAGAMLDKEVLLVALGRKY